MALFGQLRRPREEMASEKLRGAAREFERKSSRMSGKMAESGEKVGYRIANIMKRAADDIQMIESEGVPRAKYTMQALKQEVNKDREMIRKNVKAHPYATMASFAVAGMLMGAVISFIMKKMPEKQ
ncbi:hypothetical protein CUJ83_05325 [Methanocella sp. CWC-04]|uniref:DUF883 domain-containing protein n=1 Tax=Methanooceanicella nereidis TaxID=2052831 RepID=A0AAP2W6M4_9EURY|nr:hypothetical protein [Methanocella sp. CWC-04]MCD1294419.1 hypothetical protein [Methanocella sp. CWC-04]